MLPDSPRESFGRMGRVGGGGGGGKGGAGGGVEEKLFRMTVSHTTRDTLWNC